MAQPDQFITIPMTTRAEYEKGFTDETMRTRLRLAMAKNRGRVKKNCSGTHVIRQLKYSTPATEETTDGQSWDYSNHNAFKRVEIPWGSYVVKDMISRFQRKINTGENKLIDLFSAKQDNIRDSLQRTLNSELYADGRATGKTNCFWGLETFLGDDGATVAADLVARPSDTYGLNNLSTVLGNYGGTWSTGNVTPNATIGNSWPHGKGSDEYDFNSPLLLNATSTGWTGSADWETNCWRVITQGINWLTKNTGKKPSLITLGSDYFSAYSFFHESLRRIVVPHKEANDLGFPSGEEVFNHQGVAIHTDFDCPDSTGYIETIDEMTIKILGPKMFEMLGPVQDPDSGFSTLFAMVCDGQVDYRPKCYGKISPYA